MSRKRPGTDAPAYAEMMGRLIRTAGTRAATDPAALTALADLNRQLDAALTAAIRTQNDTGMSWDAIAQAVTPAGHVPSRANTRRKYAHPAPMLAVVLGEVG